MYGFLKDQDLLGDVKSTDNLKNNYFKRDMSVIFQINTQKNFAVILFLS